MIVAHRIADRVRETTTTPGIGTLTLAGAVAGFQAMSAVLTNDGDTGFFFATDGTAWEVFLGTRASSTTLQRTTIYASSNADQPVNWDAVSKQVVGDVPAIFCDWLNSIPITVPSATTTDIGAVNGSHILITGSATISSFGTEANKFKFVRFNGVLELTHNPISLILPGSKDIRTAAGDVASFVSDASGNWRCLSWMPAAGTFTPRLTIGGVDVDNAYPGSVTQTGLFVREGAQVTFSANVSLSSFLPLLVGDVQIANLPFPAAGGLDQPINVYLDGFFIPFVLYGSDVFGVVDAGAATASLWTASIAASGSIKLNNRNLTSSTRFFLSGTYLI